jgi:hypothetical protein
MGSLARTKNFLPKRDESAALHATRARITLRLYGDCAVLQSSKTLSTTTLQRPQYELRSMIGRKNLWNAVHTSAPAEAGGAADFAPTCGLLLCRTGGTMSYQKRGGAHVTEFSVP